VSAWKKDENAQALVKNTPFNLGRLSYCKLVMLEDGNNANSGHEAAGSKNQTPSCALEHSNSGKKSFDSIRFLLPNRFFSIQFDLAI